MINLFKNIRNNIIKFIKTGIPAFMLATYFMCMSAWYLTRSSHNIIIIEGACILSILFTAFVFREIKNKRSGKSEER